MKRLKEIDKQATLQSVIARKLESIYSNNLVKEAVSVETLANAFKKVVKPRVKYRSATTKRFIRSLENKIEHPKPKKRLFNRGIPGQESRMAKQELMETYMDRLPTSSPRVYGNFNASEIKDVLAAKQAIKNGKTVDAATKRLARINVNKGIIRLPEEGTTGAFKNYLGNLRPYLNKFKGESAAPRAMQEQIDRIKALDRSLPKTKRGANAVDSMAGLHEYAELVSGHKRVLGANIGSHASPAVPLHDFNMANTLTGKGSAEAANFVRTMRQGDMQDLYKVLPDLKRLKLEEGKTRLSRNALKRINEAYVDKRLGTGIKRKLMDRKDNYIRTGKNPIIGKVLTGISVV